MADYVRVYETTDEKEANKFIKSDWDLIDTPKRSNYNGEGGYSNYTQYILGLSYKEYTNKLQAVIREYEKYGFKETLFEKIAHEMDENIAEYTTSGLWPLDTPLTKYMTNYEDVVNNKKAHYYKEKERGDGTMPF